MLSRASLGRGMPLCRRGLVEGPIFIRVRTMPIDSMASQVPKFLANIIFVTEGILVELHLARVSVRLSGGKDFVKTPESAAPAHWPCCSLPRGASLPRDPRSKLEKPLDPLNGLVPGTECESSTRHLDNSRGTGSNCRLPEYRNSRLDDDPSSREAREPHRYRVRMNAAYATRAPCFS